MKRALTFIALVICTGIFAQSKSKFGIRMGINQAKVLNTDLHTKAGLYAGAFLAVQFSNAYALQPEIMYSNQGGDSQTSGAEDLNINYVSIGVANKFYLDHNQGFHFILGPSLDFNFDDNFINLINDEGSNLKITPVDLAIFAGLGYEFDFGLTMEVRYKQGMIDLDFNDDGAYSSNQEKNQLNRVIQIGLAYKFNM